jgi:hypothetical protein
MMKNSVIERQKEMSVEMPAKRVYITWLKYELLAIRFFPESGLYENTFLKCVNIDFCGILRSGSCAGKNSIILGVYAFEISLNLYQ